MYFAEEEKRREESKKKKTRGTTILGVPSSRASEPSILSLLLSVTPLARSLTHYLLAAWLAKAAWFAEAAAAGLVEAAATGLVGVTTLARTAALGGEGPRAHVVARLWLHGSFVVHTVRFCTVNESAPSARLLRFLVLCFATEKEGRLLFFVLWDPSTKT